MAEIEDNVDRELLRNVEKLRQLRIEHRDLDEIISRLALDMHIDEIQMKRLKKRKLLLKDQIARVESLLIPDLNAQPATVPSIHGQHRQQRHNQRLSATDIAQQSGRGHRHRGGGGD